MVELVSSQRGPALRGAHAFRSSRTPLFDPDQKVLREVLKRSGATCRDHTGALQRSLYPKSALFFAFNYMYHRRNIEFLTSYQKYGQCVVFAEQVRVCAGMITCLVLHRPTLHLCKRRSCWCCDCLREEMTTEQPRVVFLNESTGWAGYGGISDGDKYT